MEIDRNSWHARLYLWCLRIWAKFRYGYGHTDSAYYYRFTEETNLCLYIRAIVVWMPLVVLLHLFLLAYAIGVLSIPFLTFGWNYIGFLIVAFAAVAIVPVIGSLLTKKLKPAERLDYREKEHKENLEREAKQEAKKRRKAERSPSFTRVVIEWAKAKKAKICPIINLVESKGGTR